MAFYKRFDDLPSTFFKKNVVLVYFSTAPISCEKRMPWKQETKVPENKAKGRYRINHHTGRLELGKIELPVPRNPIARMALGGVLVAGGLVGFLPVVGFWMLPLGVIVLSYDVPAVRRARRRVAVWWSRKRAGGK